MVTCYRTKDESCPDATHNSSIRSEKGLMQPLLQVVSSADLILLYGGQVYIIY